MRELADAIIRTALEAADPRRAMEQAWVESPGPCRIVAFGKASREMLAVAIDRCKGKVTRAVIATDRPELVPTHPWLTALRADHPLPTEHNLAAADAIAACVRECSPDETLIALISGGGSAHLASPVPSISLDELSRLSSFLMKAGATIHELNGVRRHVERFKGGRLAAMCPARAIEVFVMSDVIGDPLHDIASGPFAPDPTTFGEALGVLERLDAIGVAPSVTRLLRGTGKAHGLEPRATQIEARTPGDSIFTHVRHHIIASNRLCVDAIATMLESRGIRACERRYDTQGEAREWAAWLGGRATQVHEDDPSDAWIIGGEPVVRVGDAKGRGGPSQEVALHAAKHISGAHGVTLVAFSTDGVDGPSGNAGAVVDGESWAKAIALGLDPQAALDRHDSATVHERLGSAIRTGPTGTNLNHVAVLVKADGRRQMADGK